MDATTVEIYGRREVGEREFHRGRPYRIAKVLSVEEWDSDRIDDEDEFGRSPGWYSWVEIEPDQLTAAEAAEIAAKFEEKAAKVAAKKAEQAAYRESIEAMKLAHSHLIVGLVPTQRNVRRVAGRLTAERVGEAQEPGTGCSGTTELEVFRESDGRVALVSFGCPYDYGPSYWASPEIEAELASAERTCSHWVEGKYHYKDYPGPTVPREELTATELLEVGRLEAARAAHYREEELGQLKISAESSLRDAGLVPNDCRFSHPPKRPFLAIKWELSPGEGMEDWLAAGLVDHLKGRNWEFPNLETASITVWLPAEAFAGKRPKVRDYPAETKGTTRRCLRFAVHYLPLGPSVGERT